MKETKKRPHILNNLGQRVISLVAAVLLWIIVNNINDPISTKRIANVPVKLQHTSLITDQGEVYTILDSTDTVPVVTVTARRSVLDDLTRDDITATADIENLTNLDTVEIKYSSTRYSSEIESIDGSLDNVHLSIEPKMTDSFPLVTETNGEVSDGYELDTVTPEQNQIRVSGPESVVSSIASAKAVVDVSGATGSITTYADIKLLDAEGNTIDTANLSMNITSVKVSVTILPLKTIPIEVEVSGDPADGYLRNGVVTADPETVKLAGKTSVLSEITAITIPAEVVNIEGSTSSYQTTVNIRDYLPEGVTLADSQSSGEVNITVGIEQAQTSEFAVSLSDVVLENVPEGYTAELKAVNDGKQSVARESVPDTFKVSVTGLTSVVDAIKVSDLAPSINVGKLISDSADRSAGGIYTAPVEITTPEGTTVNNTVMASVELTAQSAAGSEDQGDAKDDE